MIEMVCFIEQWLPITINNVKPYYFISNYGRVFSIYSNSFIEPQLTENGYFIVGLMTNNGNRIHRKVHRLVMITFCPIPNPDSFQVNHKDCNKLHNWLWNLEWCTPKENIEHAINNNLRSSVGEFNPMAKLTESQVLQIYNLLINNYTDNQIVSIVGCNKDMIRDIASGRTWSYLFNDDQLKAMKRTRNGSYIFEEEKHAICKFYQNNINNYINLYNKAKLITNDALNYLSIPINDKSIRIARRLFFRLQNPEITSQYIY